MFGFGGAKKKRAVVALARIGELWPLAVEQTDIPKASGVVRGSHSQAVILWANGLDSNGKQWFPHRGFTDAQLADYEAGHGDRKQCEARSH
ncbi:hypothetical protein [Zavarzinella formosa]|uniref:hypothetical protein n=1 Tax=Zavarzinella formosa TaxID=360055 RepID=UPI000374E4D9|nr:hypothetical protein [Zavarzinella formosa]